MLVGPPPTHTPPTFAERSVPAPPAAASSGVVRADLLGGASHAGVPAPPAYLPPQRLDCRELPPPPCHDVADEAPAAGPAATVEEAVQGAVPSATPSGAMQAPRAARAAGRRAAAWPVRRPGREVRPWRDAEASPGDGESLRQSLLAGGVDPSVGASLRAPRAGGVDPTPPLGRGEAVAPTEPLLGATTELLHGEPAPSCSDEATAELLRGDHRVAPTPASRRPPSCSKATTELLRRLRQGDHRAAPTHCSKVTTALLRRATAAASAACRDSAGDSAAALADGTCARDDAPCWRCWRCAAAMCGEGPAAAPDLEQRSRAVEYPGLERRSGTSLAATSRDSAEVQAATCRAAWPGRRAGASRRAEGGGLPEAAAADAADDVPSVPSSPEHSPREWLSSGCSARTWFPTVPPFPEPPPSAATHMVFRTQAPPGIQAFLFELQRPTGRELGLDLRRGADGRCLVVQHVVEGGLIDAWNRALPECDGFTVCPEDVLVAVNGTADGEGILRACRHDLGLKMVVARACPAADAPPSPAAVTSVPRPPPPAPTDEDVRRYWQRFALDRGRAALAVAPAPPPPPLVLPSCSGT